MAAWSSLSMLPDLDVVGFAFGVAYGDPWGHRGASHSLVFAVSIAALLAALSPLVRLPLARTGVFAAIVIASHGLLDTLTDGGLGCALFWPFSDARFFAPWRPIPVAPIGPAFVSMRGLKVAVVELSCFVPVFAYALFWRGRATEGSASRGI